jgi:hypothetical protein
MLVAVVVVGMAGSVELNQYTNRSKTAAMS